MNFLNPALLLGLLAVAVPIFVHLYNRRKAVRRPFPAIAFLIRSKKNLDRQLRLKQWLLLALRIAFFVLLPLAMSRPFARCGGEAERTVDRLPASVVFVVDSSASMTMPVGRGTAWSWAIDRATDRLSELRPWDRVALVVAGPTPALEVGDLVEDRGIVRDALRALKPLSGRSDLPAALAAAREIHAASTQPLRRTIVLTDGTAAPWGSSRGEPTPIEGLGVLEVLAPDASARRANVAVAGLVWSESADGAPGSWRIEATLHRRGDAPDRVAGTLVVDGTPVGTGFAEFGDAETTTLPFTHTIEGVGVREVEVRLDPGVGAGTDDRRVVALEQRRGLRVLLVNGAPRSVQYNDELFYLSRALELTDGEGAGIVVSTTDAERAAAVPLDEIDVVVLANVGALPAAEAQRLASFVERGGGLLVSVGDNLVPDVWSQANQALLPAPIRAVKKLADRDDPDVGIKATRIGAIDVLHPAFRVFSLPGGESLQSAAVLTYALLEPPTDPSVRTLASYADGAPFLVERVIGRGRVLLMTTSVDMDWTDLPIRTSWVPLSQRLVEYLARRTGDARREAVPGERFELDVEALGAPRVAVVRPDGQREVIETVDGRAELIPTLGGLHRVFVPSGDTEIEVPALAFAANPPPVESEIASVPDATIDAWVRAAGGAGGGGAGEGTGPRRDLWPLLLFVGLLVIYAESLLSLRRRLWESLLGPIRARLRRSGAEGGA